MKKVVLGVVALCVAMSSAWGCEKERREYAECLRYHASGKGSCMMSNGHYKWRESLEKLKMNFEACLIKKGYY